MLFRIAPLVLGTLVTAHGCRSAGGGTPETAAASVGRRLEANGLRDSLTSILQAGVRDSAFPGAIAVVGTKDGAVVTISAGQLDWAPSPPPDSSTLWDMASLTKVIGLTSAMML